MDRWLNDFHYEPEIRERLMDPNNLRWLYETYYGIVYELDRRIGQLLELLRKKGLDEETAILFLSDHGDMLAHRGMVQKRCFYERSARAALIAAFPGRWQQGRRRQTPVSLIDLFPTVAECVGAPMPEDLPGKSLLTSLTDGREPEDRPVFCEYHGEGVHAPCFMVRYKQFKYVYVHGYEERLYDVVQDPDEYVNLLADGKHEDAACRLRKTLLEHFDPEEVSRKAVISQQNRGFVYDCAVRSNNSTHA
jgi:choline-sulfatase